MWLRKPGRIYRKALRILAIAGAVGALLTITGVALFTLEVLSRPALRLTPATTHPTLTRRQCIECHAPIAAEWRQSFHSRSLTGPYWRDVRALGYMKIFERTRKACVNCHSPANVLDLVGAEAAAGSSAGPLGVECTPNLLREPRGVVPAARADEVELGVDCTSCHVGKHGIVGPGRHGTDAHATLTDPRFENPALASEALCGLCHSAIVRAWKKSKFAAQEVTCLSCHMPPTTAAAVAGGPQRARRSHRFLGDKDPSLLARAVRGTLTITGDRKARFLLTNDQVGHHLPSGGNWLSVQFKAIAGDGRTLRQQVEAFGKDEPLLLDLWPFNRDRRIPAGEERQVLFSLPEGHGSVEVVVRYHDWMRTKATVLTLREEY